MRIPSLAMPLLPVLPAPENCSLLRAQGFPDQEGPESMKQIASSAAVYFKALAGSLICFSLSRAQGFPDQEGPESMKEIASKALYEQSMAVSSCPLQCLCYHS
jgi:hypothetical protein